MDTKHQWAKHNISLVFIFFSISVHGQKLEFFTNGRLMLGTYKERTASICAGDIDKDGDVDILVANGRHWPGQNRVFLNNGRGIFTVSRRLGSEMETSYATELADFDGDGRLDIIESNSDEINLYYFNR